MRRPALVGGLVASGLVVLWAEIVHLRASRALVGPDRGGSEAIVVLGYRNADPRRANWLNRWRVRAALRSVDPQSTGSRLVFCGTTRTACGAVSEAAMMAAYAVEQRGWSGPVVLEEESRTTWQNVVHAIPLVEDVDRVKIVSNPLHALKARLYLHRQRPDLARRLVRAADYRPGEWAPLTPFFAVYGLRTLAKLPAAASAQDATACPWTRRVSAGPSAWRSAPTRTHRGPPNGACSSTSITTPG